jgi:hypothetical protein
MHEDIFAVLPRNKAEAFRVIEPLYGTLFHTGAFFLDWIALDESERTLAESCLVRRFKKILHILKRYGRVLLTPGSVLTLT